MDLIRVTAREITDLSYTRRLCGRYCNKPDSCIALLTLGSQNNARIINTQRSVIGSVRQNDHKRPEMYYSQFAELNLFIDMQFAQIHSNLLLHIERYSISQTSYERYSEVLSTSETAQRLLNQTANCSCNSAHCSHPLHQNVWLSKQFLIQQQSETAYFRQRESGLNPDDFQNLTGTSLFKVTFVIKFSWSSDQFVQRYEPNCGKMPHLAVLKNPFKFSGSESESANEASALTVDCHTSLCVHSHP